MPQREHPSSMILQQVFTMNFSLAPSSPPGVHGDVARVDAEVREEVEDGARAARRGSVLVCWAADANPVSKNWLFCRRRRHGAAVRQFA